MTIEEMKLVCSTNEENIKQILSGNDPIREPDAGENAMKHYAWVLPAESAFALHDLLSDSSIFEAENGLWHVDFYCSGEQALPADFLSDHPNYNFNILPNQDWVAFSAVSTPPISVGNFYIHTPHYPPSCEHRFQLCLEATTAFGSGHHATTQGCLQLIQDIWATTGWKKALDFGSGSGILAMAMNRLSPGSALGMDNDAETITVARENAKKNACPTVFIYGDAMPSLSQISTCSESFDCIVANVYAPILIDLAPQFSDAKNVILSGILQVQAQAVIDAYETLGWQLEKTIEKDEWTSLWLKK